MPNKTIKNTTKTKTSVKTVKAPPRPKLNIVRESYNPLQALKNPKTK